MIISKKFNSLSDEEMVARYKASLDNVYIGELYKKYTHLVYGVCYKYLKDQELSKDACMQVFEKLLQDLLTHDVVNFKSWLYSVTKNHCLMKLRSSKGHFQINLSSQEDEFMENTQIVHQTEDQSLEIDLQKLEEGLTQLNGPQKICVEQFYLQEKSYKEICESTGYSLNEVKSYIQNGKRNLKNYLVIHKSSIIKVLLLILNYQLFSM